MNEPKNHGGVKRRRLFGPSDDIKLERILRSQEFNGWKNVARQMPGFTPKQLRDRWHNYISPKNSFGPWTPEEDQIVVQKVKEFGTKWSLIASFLNGRSDNSIKNRWNTVLRDECAVNPQKFSQTPIELPVQAMQPVQQNVFQSYQSSTSGSDSNSSLNDSAQTSQLMLDSRFVQHFFQTPTQEELKEYKVKQNPPIKVMN